MIGLMIVTMMEIGSIIKCMVSENFIGLMVQDSKESTFMTRKRGSGSSFGKKS